MRRGVTILAGLLVVIGLSNVLRAEGRALPEGVKGFKGTVTGTVVETTRDGRGVVVKVTAMKPADGSKAEKPEAAVGQNVLINVQWEQTDGKWHPVEAQVKYIKTLERGQEVSIQVVNDEGDRLHITQVP